MWIVIARRDVAGDLPDTGSHKENYATIVSVFMIAYAVGQAVAGRSSTGGDASGFRGLDRGLVGAAALHGLARSLASWRCFARSWASVKPATGRAPRRRWPTGFPARARAGAGHLQCRRVDRGGDLRAA